MRESRVFRDLRVLDHSIECPGMSRIGFSYGRNVAVIRDNDFLKVDPEKFHLWISYY